jgi:hypothetical protein
MRFTVHAKHNREPIERRFASIIDATREAWRLMAAGATGVYIFYDSTGKACWPEGFAELASGRVASSALVSPFARPLSGCLQHHRSADQRYSCSWSLACHAYDSSDPQTCCHGSLRPVAFSPAPASSSPPWRTTGPTGPGDPSEVKHLSDVPERRGAGALGLENNRGAR